MITVRIWGGLGNQMFQYAYARALKERTSQDVMIDKKGIFKRQLEIGRIRSCAIENFRITLPEVDNAEERYAFLRRGNAVERVVYELSIRGLIHPWYYLETDEGFNGKLYDLTEDSYLQGWFQNERYFFDQKRIICDEFQLVHEPDIGEEMTDILNAEETVSVHIRRGDYKSIDCALPPGYQNQAISVMKKKFGDPLFLFFSDDVGWVKKHIDLPKRYMFVSDGIYRDYEEQWLMSRCKHNIIANSTFSWWGAWLNANPDKLVIAPKSWMRLREPLSIVPSEWVVI